MRIIDKLKEKGEQTLKIASQMKIDEAEAYLVYNKVLTIRLVNNSIFEAKGIEDIGLGVRVILGNGLGFSSTSDLSQEGIIKTIESAIKATKTRTIPKNYSFPKPAKKPLIEGIYDKKLAELPEEEAVEIAFQMINESLNYSTKIEDNAGVLNIIEYHTVIMNTHGLCMDDSGTFFEASLTATAKEASTTSEGSESIAGRSLDKLKANIVGKSAAKIAVDGLKAEKISEGEYQLILDATPTADITSYASMLVSPPIAKLYMPLFLNKIGEKIGSEILTLIDNPLMSGGIGSSSIDDEGVPSRKTTIIENGVLKTFVYDTFYAKLENRQSTGNAIREIFTAGISSLPGKNYNSEPIPLPRNPYIEPRDWKKKEIIEDTKEGLLSKFFHYTRITNPIRGDFTSVLRMGLYYIKNGEITYPVKKSRIMDNFFNILKNIDAISSELAVGGGWGSYTHAPTIRTKAHITPV